MPSPFLIPLYSSVAKMQTKYCRNAKIVLTDGYQTPNIIINSQKCKTQSAKMQVRRKPAMSEIVNQEEYKAPKILVLGIGGGGNNALNRMIEHNEFPVHYIAVNTDKMVLEKSKAEECVAIGEKLTGGYGAGGDPEIGAASAEENTEAIENLVHGAQMVILTCGMGGGTGTGAIPVIAKICQEQRILTVAVVTKPFSFEGHKKMQIADTGIAKLRDVVDTLLIIPNNKLLEMNDKTLNLDAAFLLADSVLQNAIQAITNIIFNCGTINLDFNDLRTVLSKKGEGHLGISSDDESGDIIRATEAAMNSPLLDTELKGASYVLVNCSGRINLAELNSAIAHIQEAVGEDTYVMWGTVAPAEESDTITVTIIATGLNKKPDSILPKQSIATTQSNFKSQEEMTDFCHKIQEQQKKYVQEKQKSIDIPLFLRHK